MAEKYSWQQSSGSAAAVWPGRRQRAESERGSARGIWLCPLWRSQPARRRKASRRATAAGIDSETDLRRLDVQRPLAAGRYADGRVRIIEKNLVVHRTNFTAVKPLVCEATLGNGRLPGAIWARYDQ